MFPKIINRSLATYSVYDDINVRNNREELQNDENLAKQNLLNYCKKLNMRELKDMKM